ncbi:EPM2A-interacting protein 1-like [Centruroides vittatus]|uniref:EPM2A-interacting protein 1-like n=1 Tax=Centruroides vittatus TaxID=120091 RepID=UPI00350F0678
MKEKLKSYEDSLRRLHGEFERRFEDFSAIEKDFEIFGMPFNVNCDTVKPDLQLELIELQCNTQLKQLFLNVPKLEFYKSFSKSTFPNLISHAQKVTAMFASSYICEQVFSTMKLRKSCLRNRLTDEHLTSLLRISASQFEPNYEKLVEMQSQFYSSHSLRNLSVINRA